MIDSLAVVNGNERFLSALRCETVDRPPVWLMRQAGRVLPEYRALREKHSFLELVQTPQLCAEVTLQPIRRFGFDAAILFSDILVIPEALGQGYCFCQEGGIRMAFQLLPKNFETSLQWKQITNRLEYVSKALSLIKKGLLELPNQPALLGFAGSPWTLACFMCEGSGGLLHSDTPPRALKWYEEDPKGFDAFMTLLADVVAEYILMQWKYGIDAAQIFDSLSRLIPESQYWNVSGKYIDRVLQKLSPRQPTIVYCKGPVWKELVHTNVQVLSVDWNQSLSEVKAAVGPNRCVQGNLNPVLLSTYPETVRVATNTLLNQMRGQNGFILNLGHGLAPNSKIDCITALMETVQQFALQTT